MPAFVLLTCLVAYPFGMAIYFSLSDYWVGSPGGWVGLQNYRDILGNETFRHVIDSCLRDYQITIVDCPPADKYADGRRIGTLVGYGVIVARKDVSLLNDIHIVADQMREDGVRVIGTVLNEIEK